MTDAPPKEQYQYIIVRGDLSPGLQIAQVAHAALDFAIEFPDIAKRWKQNSNYICVLQVPNEEALLDYADLAWKDGVEFVCFYDPDVDHDGSHTALAVAPGEFYTRLAQLPLALREGAVV